MRFAATGWFWALLILPVVYVLLIWDDRRRQKRFEEFAQKSVWNSIAPEIDPRARSKKALVFVLAVGFGILALARPQWGTREETAKMSGLDVMVVLDVSNSMETEDVVPSRLKKAKHLIRNLAEHLQGDRMGLVAFAGGASLATPLTTDLDYFLQQLQIQSPKSIPSQGTDIGLGLETAARAMDRGAESSARSENETRPSRAIVLVSDGEDFEGAAKDAATKLKAVGIKLYVFGVGTEKGGAVPVRDDSGSLQAYKRDRSGQPVVSSFHPDDLIQIASSAGGRYWNVTSDEDEIGQMLQDMGAMTRGEFAEHRYVVYEERFQYPLFIAVILLLWEMSFSYRKRRGIAMVGLLCVWAMVATSSSVAQASDLETYMENKKGVDAYRQGKIEEAEKRFGSAQALDPSRPELSYNQGLVKMQKGDTESAARDFQEAARGAAQTGNADLAGRSYFNLGSALSKKGDLKGAIQSYLSAIDSAKQSKDAQLDRDSRKNIELLVQEQQKQKQQQKDQEQQQKDQKKQDQQEQQQSQKQKQDSKEDDKGQDQKQDKKDQGQDQKKQDQGKRYETSDSRKKKFESKKLTAEDADRVMSELKNRERDLQGRMKKKNENSTNNTKDW